MNMQNYLRDGLETGLQFHRQIRVTETILFGFICHNLSQIWRRLHRENADPLNFPEAIRRGVWGVRAHFFLPFVEGKEVLELGCGYGYNAFLFSRKAKKCLGVDVDKVAIAKARENYGQIENLCFIKDDALNFLKKIKDKFDIIVLFEFIEHVDAETQRELLRRVNNCLRPGGYVFLSTPNGKIVPFYRKNPFHENELSLTELSELIEESGFKIEEIKGQTPLWWLFIPVPWSWLERLWILFGIYKKIHKIRENPETSRTILLRAKKPVLPL